jgi:hypothetical protein
MIAPTHAAVLQQKQCGYVLHYARIHMLRVPVSLRALAHLQCRVSHCCRRDRLTALLVAAEHLRQSRHWAHAGSVYVPQLIVDDTCHLNTLCPLSTLK